MTQKPNAELSRREAILSAALPLFLENGYEKTSVRMIANKVGCEVGLVYYYFSTKDDVFENALALYFENQEKALTEITEKTKKDASLFLEALFTYFEKEAPAFAKTFNENVHWTIRFAVRTKFVELVRPHMEEVVSILASDSRMPYTVAVTAKTASDMLVGAALESENGYFAKNKEELHRILSHILSLDRASGRRREIPSFLL